MHHASFLSTDFQASWRAEPLAFCAECHAPDRKRLGAVGEQRGIGCGSCHTLSEAHGTPGAARGKTASCVPCHDFPAPNSSAFLQSTAREHAQGRYASTSCATCHMPRNGTSSGIDHAFDSSRNHEHLQRAVEISSVVRGRGPTGKNEVIVTLHTVGVGHFFPTGDIFRRLTLGVVAVNAGGEIVCTETFHFNRNWGAHAASMRTGVLERFEEDTRLTEAARTLRVSCEGEPRDVEVSLTYTRGRAANASFFEAFDSLELRRDHFVLAR